MKNLMIVAIAIVFAFSGCGNADTPNSANSPNAVGGSTPSVAETPSDDYAMGRSLYQQNCAACHKEDGTGGKMTIEGKTLDPDDLTSDKIKKFDDAKLMRYVYEGVEDEGMPAFKDLLSEAQIREVVRYVRAELQQMPSTPLPAKQ